MSLASAFLYALLTNRVLVVSDNGGGIADLFCDPFPGATWLLPQDFPIKINQLENLNQKSPECYSNILKLSEHSLPVSVRSSFVYLHLVHGYDDYDKLFFCDQDKISLQNVSWVIMRSHYYFIPSLFMMPSFGQELATLFPQKETVFHFLGRYLFFPSNPVWELITRYYQAYLSKSDEKIGIQIRTDTRFLSLFFNATKFTFQAVLDTILSCSLDNNILPEINSNDPLIISPRNGKSISVLVTSLTSGFDGKIRDIYWEHSTVNGDAVRVFQPSAEGEQKTGNKTHDRKAWAEMFLLSLGGLKPWILHKPENGTVTNPPCTRAISMEPCFHSPPCNACKTRYAHAFDFDAGVPHVRHCEDTRLGLKLADPKGNNNP
ncbi:galactoside 2-alpha-L-fucosyltransferase-like protein [Tanacetum coccineum]